MKELPTFTPFQSAMAQQLEATLRAFPDIEKVTKNVLNTHTIWVANNGEQRLLPNDEKVVRMINGGVGGIINELTKPYTQDAKTGKEEPVFSQEGHDIAYDILEEYRRKHPTR